MHIYIYMIHLLQESAHAITDARKPPGLPSVSRRTRELGGVTQSESRGLRIRGAGGLDLICIQKAQELGGRASQGPVRGSRLAESEGPHPGGPTSRAGQVACPSPPHTKSKLPSLHHLVFSHPPTNGMRPTCSADEQLLYSICRFQR